MSQRDGEAVEYDRTFIAAERAAPEKSRTEIVMKLSRPPCCSIQWSI